MGLDTTIRGDCLDVLRAFPDSRFDSLIQADSRHVPLADRSVQCVVTSPPYWKHRCYAGSQGEVPFGQEPTVEGYVRTTMDVLREARRVLKDDGVVFWNVADTYVGKGLCLIPERVAIAAQGDGWLVRNIIVWHKPNPMPASAQDRLTRSYEDIIVLVKRPNYYWNHEAAQETAVGPAGRSRRSATKECGRNDTGRVITDTGYRNMRDVWPMSVGWLKGAHPAIFPLELPRRCIRLGSRPGDVVLDLFSGSGTTGLAAGELGRSYIGFDLAYLDLARERISGAGRQAREPWVC